MKKSKDSNLIQNEKNLKEANISNSNAFRPNSGNIIHLPEKNPPKEPVHSFGAVLQKYRMQNDYSQPALAEIMGTSRNTITNWETDKSRPDYEATRKLCTLLGIPLYELYGLSNDSLPSPHEGTILHQYRQLSSVSQKIVDLMISNMLREETDARGKMLRESYFILPLQSTPAAAGTGCEFTSIAPEPLFIKKNTFNDAADALVRVSGQSMEPLYHSGDLVYIKYTDSADEEDDVVCSTADGAVIKRLRNRKLYSLNPKFPYGEKTDDDHVRIIGKVLGIVAADEIPDAEDSRLLEDLLSPEMREFYKKYGE